MVAWAGAAVLLLAAVPHSAGAQAPQLGRQSLLFVTHASFFSQETRRAPVIDPQVFVKEDSAGEATGPQNIQHIAGLRPARIDDAPELVAYNARGDSLGFTLARWFAATGTLDIDPSPNAGPRLTCSFKRLIPFGIYSLFRITFSNDGASFAPLDGDGTTNNFTAGVDGAANIVVNTPDPLGPGNAIVAVYHSDSQQHGNSRGEIGLTAHHELIVRIPAR